MSEEPSFCVTCAWREDCQKKFLYSKDASLRCRDYTKDVRIKKESVDDKKENRGDPEGGNS